MLSCFYVPICNNIFTTRESPWGSPRGWGWGREFPPSGNRGWGIPVPAIDGDGDGEEHPRPAPFSPLMRRGHFA